MVAVIMGNYLVALAKRRQTVICVGKPSSIIAAHGSAEAPLLMTSAIASRSGLLADEDSTIGSLITADKAYAMRGWHSH